MEEILKTKEKANSGITLIALVITIIVLLILAGVSIAMLTGQNGILTQAQNSKTTTELKSAEEKVKLAIMAARSQSETGALDADKLIAEITNNYGGTASKTNNGFPVNATVDGKNFKVDGDGNITGGTTPTPEPANKISNTESYVGYYADIDGDGTVDGVIYADLAIGGSGKWNNDSWSNYEYSQKTEGLKSYYVSSDSYTGLGNQWTKPVLTTINGSGTQDRFYVMALEDFNPGTAYCWYYSAAGKLDNTISYSTNDFGQGKTNTTTMIAEWNKGTSGKYGAQNDKDMWGVIQKADNSGKKWNLDKWFVPSKAEWATFGDMTYTKMGVTTSNYSNYGLKNSYWSSAQRGTDDAYFAYFDYGNIRNGYVSLNDYVRLSATF